MEIRRVRLSFVYPSIFSCRTPSRHNMFGTLHFNTGSNETHFVERSTKGGEQGGSAVAHFACDNCRAKKVECQRCFSVVNHH